MTRLLGYVQFDAPQVRADLDEALHISGEFIKSLFFGVPTAEEVNLPNCQIQSWSLCEHYKCAGGDKLAVLDAGAVIFPTANRSELGKSFLANRDELPKTLRNLRGDFAGIIFNQLSGEVSLFRDHVGVKPLYYLKGEGYVAFSSHPGALLFFPGCSRKCNRQFAALVGCSHYRTFDNNPGASPYRDVCQVESGTILTFDKTTQNTIKYWKLDDNGYLKESAHSLAERYKELLLTAVSRRLSIEGKRGFTLSGGMDSSSILSCAVKILHERLEAYSCVYSDRTYDESAEIQPILKDAVKNWNRVVVDPSDVFSTIERMVLIHGEPVATATWLSHFELTKTCLNHGVRVLFTGLGGDELNAGEYEHFFPFFADLLKGGSQLIFDEEVNAWAKNHDHPIFKKNKSVALETLSRTTDAQISGRCLPDTDRNQRYLDVYKGHGFDLAQFTPIMEHPFKSYLQNRTFQDLFRETTPCCLRAQDRHGAAFGVEIVNPFLDIDVIEFMFQISPDLKIKKGVTKYLLREAMKGVLTEETRVRVTKTGWNAPAHLWFSGPGAEMVRELIRSPSCRVGQFMDLEKVEKLLTEHETIVAQELPQVNHMMFFWQLVNLEAWFRCYQVEW